MRAWVGCCKADALPARPVRRAFSDIGIVEGAEALDRALTSVAWGTIRPLDIHSPNCLCLSDDETLLLDAAAAAQHRHVAAARDMLRRILAAPAIDAVIEPLRAVGILLALKGILLPRPDRRDGNGATVPRFTLH